MLHEFSYSWLKGVDLTIVMVKKNIRPATADAEGIFNVDKGPTGWNKK